MKTTSAIQSLEVPEKGNWKMGYGRFHHPRHLPISGESCVDHSDCSPMFSCVEGECFCRFGPAMPCAPSIFRFVPLNQIPLKKFSAVKKFHGFEWHCVAAPISHPRGAATQSVENFLYKACILLISHVPYQAIVIDCKNHLLLNLTVNRDERIKRSQKTS